MKTCLIVWVTHDQLWWWRDAQLVIFCSKSSCIHHPLQKPNFRLPVRPHSSNYHNLRKWFTRTIVNTNQIVKAINGANYFMFNIVTKRCATLISHSETQNTVFSFKPTNRSSALWYGWLPPRATVLKRQKSQKIYKYLVSKYKLSM